jgi:threonine dehydrogenase-like Zn-dependent dehydrogenase
MYLLKEPTTTTCSFGDHRAGELELEAAVVAVVGHGLLVMCFFQFFPRSDGHHIVVVINHHQPTLYKNRNQVLITIFSAF